MDKLVACAFLVLLPLVASSRILLFPIDHHGHVNFFGVIGQELIQRGHEVDMLVTNRSAHLAVKKGVHAIVPPYTHLMNPNQFENVAFGNTSLFDMFSSISKLCNVQIKELFANTEIMKTLSSNKYDIALMDGVDVARAQYLVPYSLNVPFITINARHDGWIARVPNLPSVEGETPMKFLDKSSTFFDRLSNLFFRIMAHNFLSPPTYVLGIYDDLFEELVPEKPVIGFQKLYQSSEIFLINMDIICLDTSRTSAPHYQFIGGLGAQDAKPLPKELENIITSATDGVIILSFGSGIKNIPMDMLVKLLNAFKGLKQKVIMRHVGDVPDVIPDNVFIQSWMPQNDLLGHKNTRLFISHVGNNGQLEGVYHGVPMLMMPVLGDQMINAKRAYSRGYGVIMNPHDFTTEELKKNIKEMLKNPHYAENIKRCSKILHALPSPQSNAAFWIEHVLRFGGDHLKPYYMDMPLWQYFMLDVLLFVLLVTH